MRWDGSGYIPVQVSIQKTVPSEYSFYILDSVKKAADIPKSFFVADSGEFQFADGINL